MNKGNVFKLNVAPANGAELLQQLARCGAADLLTEAVEVELDKFLSSYARLRDQHGRRQVVRNGYLPARWIPSGYGQVELRIPRIRDRSGLGIRFRSALLPAYRRKAAPIEPRFPWLYLQGWMAGDFSEALCSLLGAHASGITNDALDVLKANWQRMLWTRRQRLLGASQYTWIWADRAICAHGDLRTRPNLLWLAGAALGAEPELLGVSLETSDSVQAWAALLAKLKQRGLLAPAQWLPSPNVPDFTTACNQVYARMASCGSGE